MLLLFSSMVMGFSACSDDDEEVTIKAELTANPTNLEFSALGGENDVTVSTKLDSWNVTPDASANWCTVTKGEGKFTVKVEEFTERQDRKATLKITSGDESIDFIVTQKAVSAELTPEKTEVSINGFGSAVKIKMTASSNEWTATTEDSWIRTEKNGEYLIIRATLSSSDRTGKINLSLNDAKSEITVKQSGAETTVGSVVLGEDGTTAIGVIVNNVDSTNCIYVVSLKEEFLNFSKEVKFYTYTDTITTNGQKATAIFKEIEGYKEKFPAIAFCDQIEEMTGVKGWYIPAYKEQEVWQGLIDNKDVINTTLQALNADILMKTAEDPEPKYSHCWTSTTKKYDEDDHVESVRTKKTDFTKNDYVYGYYPHSTRCFLKIEYLAE